MQFILDFLNSPAGIALCASITLMSLNYLYSKKPEWKKYEGTIIAAIRHAEKAIGSGSENAGMKKFDHALQFILKIYEKNEGKQPSSKKLAELKEGISIVHEKSW